MLRVMTLSKNGAKPSQSERQTTIKSIEKFRALLSRYQTLMFGDSL